MDIENELLEVYRIGDGSLSVDFPHKTRFNCNVERIGGEWCRLVPSEEVENSFAEGWLEASKLPCRYDEAWDHSRAKQVAEGFN